VHHFKLNNVDFGQCGEQTFQRGARIVEALLRKQPRDACWRKIAVPGVNFACPPFDLQAIVETTERQRISSHLSPPVEGKRPYYSTSKPLAGKHEGIMPNAMEH